MKRDRYVLNTTLLVLGTIIVTSMTLTYLAGKAVITSEQQIDKLQSEQHQLEVILSLVKDAETGQRGYLLTGEADYLQPYTEAVGRVELLLSQLRDPKYLSGLPPGVAQSLDTTIRQKLAELAHTVTLRQQQGLSEALAVVRNNQGKILMDQIREQVRPLQDQQQASINAQYEKVERLTRIRTRLFLAVGTVCLMLLFWVRQRLGREMQAREESVKAMAEQQELLRVTLASIGDAVIVTDLQGRITYLNAVAEATTGWTLAEAVGKPCQEVFRIINEESRKVVDSPVDKVLQLGIIVGLANHTLLIRKDGSEVPIDDSGAPIRHQDGTLRGVVLVFRDFSEHKTIERNLRQAKNDADQANRAKDNFLATLSHELRTPLTPVLATLSTWEVSEELPQSFKADAAMLRRNIELEARLIDDLLDLTRILKGKLPLNMETVDLHDVLTSTSTIVKPDLQAKRIHFSMDLSARQHFVRGDTARLHQIIWNLLKNAAKFSDPEGTITLRTQDNSDGTVTVQVTDTGIGIAPEVLQRLFRPFEQGSAEINHRFGGLGLGLAIAKALMDAHGGSIQVRSDGPTRGATFLVQLPTIPEPAPQQPVTMSRKAARAALRILLVEDHFDTAKVMSRLLAASGHQVQVAGSVAEGVALAKRDPFDVLLSDLGLPDGTGLDFLQAVREFSAIPAVALTGFGMDTDIAKCREAGFAAHLTKPVNFRRLEEVLDQVASGKADD